jgi:hypothetical protein
MIVNVDDIQRTVFCPFSFSTYLLLYLSMEFLV